MPGMNRAAARSARPRLFAVRRGISIIEVLISIVVATVGVFGVFALIPFAIRQTEIGRNEEAAITTARNAISDFENQGYSDPTRWAILDFRDDNGAAGTTDYLSPFDPGTTGAGPTCTSEFYCIDPWGFWQHELANDNDFAYAPYSDYSTSGILFPRMRRISLFQRGSAPPVPIDRSLARQLCASPDDIVVTKAKDNLDLDYPLQPYFNGGLRQYEGRTSWMVFVTRVQPALDDYRFLTVVFQNRDTNASRTSPDTARLYDRLYRVEMPGGSTTPLYQTGGGDFRLREISTPLTSDYGIRRGTWVMLIGSDDSATDPTIRSIGFYRVVEADLVTAAATTPRLYDVSLQGGDFTITPSTTSGGDSTYYAVILPDVLAVYERTMRMPTPSNWN